jgi:RimJ/RimL family protein N-acetyltransferase
MTKPIIKQATGTEEEAKAIYKLRFSPESRAVSMSKKKPTFNQHICYYYEHFEQYQLIYLADLIIGFIRQDEKGYISIALSKHARGRGVASRFLTLYRGKAIIKLENKPSLKAFENAGFKIKGHYLEK